MLPAPAPQLSARPQLRPPVPGCGAAPPARLHRRGRSASLFRAHPEGQSSAINEDLLRSSMLQEADRHMQDSQAPEAVAHQQHASSGHPAGQAKSVMANTVSAVSWQQWLSHFEACDAAAERLEELGISLQDAVRREDYQLAARLKSEMAGFEQQDVVADVQKQLKAALEQERYSDAAALSQGGLTGLQGWWAGQSDNDPVGHLLHVKQEYSRWTGSVFRPRDVTTMKVNKAQTGFGRALPRSSLPTTKPKGSPVFEVFLRNKSSSTTAPSQYLHQAVSLQLAPFDEATLPAGQTRDTGRRGSRASPPAQEGEVLRLSVSVRQDGTAHIKPLPLNALRGSENSSAWSRPAGSTRGSSSRPEPVDSQVASLGSDEVVDIASQNAMSSLEEGEDSTPTIVSDPRQVIETDSIPSSLPRGGLGARYQSPRPSGMDDAVDLLRLPARVELVGRDKLVYHVPDAHQAAAVQARWSAQPVADSEQGEADDEGCSQFEVIVPMARESATSSPAAARERSIQAETLKDLADQVARSMEAKAGKASTREDIVQAMLEVVERVVQGEPLSTIDVYLSGNSRASSSRSVVRDNATWRLPRQVSAPAAAEVTTITYKRISTDHARTDPLSGLFLGSFGPHGPELLHLSRSIVDGEEMVLATKLTGDANVPAGMVSFKAKIGRKHRLDGRDAYPDELGVTARYKGEGRIGQKGFTKPQWVEGELLVFSAKGSPLTAGAELGFVWSVPGEKRFLILLNRVELSA